MLIGILIFIVTLIAAAAVGVIHTSKKAERQRYYDAAYKMVKESCLNQALRNQNKKMENGCKPMLYLKWTDREKQGYVFDPERRIRIGRNPEENDFCIREETVSQQHCVLYAYQNEVYLKDLNSRNGTWIRRGFRRRQVQGAEPVFSGDRIIIGSLVIEVIVFTFDMAYM